MKRMLRHAIWAAVMAALSAEAWPAPARFVRFAVVWVTLMGLSAQLDRKAGRERLRRKTLRGTRELSPGEFTRSVRGDGLGVPYCPEPGLWGGRGETRHLRIRARDEPSHVLIAGDTGTGKSTLMHDFLCQIAAAPGGGGAVADGPALVFGGCHARAERGDVLLHPLYAGCPYWDLAGEVATDLDPPALAMSFLPDRAEGTRDFWDRAPREILAMLLE